MESNAENLVKGMENFAGDFDPETGDLRISQTDASAFEVGVNIAVTPGKVVFQNEMFQLLQYEPTTKNVHKDPTRDHPAVDQQVLHSPTSTRRSPSSNGRSPRASPCS